jgi:hypothetical protein
VTTKRTALISGVGIVAILALAWFATFPRGILMGDDLRLVYDIQHGGYGSSPLNAVSTAEFNTYRPLLMLIFWAVTHVFGHHFALYEALNALVEIASTVVIAIIAYRLSRQDVVVALGVAIAFAFSRLSYYAIGQLFGLMEGLGLFLTLLLVLEFIEAERTRDGRRVMRAAILFGIAIFIDERYVVVAPFVVCAALWFYRERLTARSFVYAALPIVFLALNIAVKTFVLHAHFLTGTGHPLVFDAATIVAFFESGLWNVIGYNVGPAYLSGQDVADTGSWGYVWGTLLALPFIGGIVALVRAFSGERSAFSRGVYVPMLLWLVLFVPLLLSASVNTRQEFRWIYGPFAIALVGLSGIAGCISNRPAWVRAGAACLVAGTIASALLYRTSAGNIYFYYSDTIAENVARLVTPHPTEPVVIVSHGEPTIEQWVFMGREFFDEYGLVHGGVTFLNAASDLAKLALPPGVHPTVLDVTGGAVSELDASAFLAVAKTNGVAPLRSFITTFGTGTINSLAPVATPTGHGVFVNTWPSQSGPRLGLTVVATYRYRFSNIPIAPHETLNFFSAAPYAIGKGSRAFVDVVNGAKTTRLYAEDLAPATPSGPIWSQHAVSLDSFSGKRISIVFGADVRDGDPTAAWAVFGTPELVR